MLMYDIKLYCLSLGLSHIWFVDVAIIGRCQKGGGGGWNTHAWVLGLLTFFASSRPLFYSWGWWSIWKCGKNAIELKIIILNLFTRLKKKFHQISSYSFMIGIKVVRNVIWTTLISMITLPGCIVLPRRVANIFQIQKFDKLLLLL